MRKTVKITYIKEPTFCTIGWECGEHGVFTQVEDDKKIEEMLYSFVPQLVKLIKED